LVATDVTQTCPHTPIQSALRHRHPLVILRGHFRRPAFEKIVGWPHVGNSVYVGVDNPKRVDGAKRLQMLLPLSLGGRSNKGGQASRRQQNDRHHDPASCVSSHRPSAVTARASQRCSAGARPCSATTRRPPRRTIRRRLPASATLHAAFL